MKVYYAESISKPILYRIVFGPNNAWLATDSMKWVLSTNMTAALKLKPISAKQIPAQALRPVALQDLIKDIFKYSARDWFD